ncbi:MAG: PE-PPE domain-containing protein [Actinomycetia bacterium]|nr:PE-PPE domain-containing protein [Actinomycetes bacterium]
MRTAIRKAGVACGTFFASSALAFTTASGAWGSNSALVVAGLQTPTMHDLVMAQLLGGALKGQQRVSINWPAEAAPFTGEDDLTLGESIGVGVDNLGSEIEAALSRLEAPGEKVTVLGLSAGSLVVNDVLRELDSDPNAPAADQITFIVVADSSRQQVVDTDEPDSRFGYTYLPTPVTKYDVSVVVAEFDGSHDFPDRWWNFTAVINAIAGTIVSHIPVMFEDLSEVPATHITTDVNNEGGTTTTYLVPSEELPLVTLLPFLKSSEPALRASVERGYKRYDGANNVLRQSVTAAAVAETEAAETEAAEAEAAETAESQAAETEAAEAEAEAAEAAEAEAAESEAAESAAAEAEAEGGDASGDADAASSDSSDDSGADSAADSGASDSE